MKSYELTPFVAYKLLFVDNVSLITKTKNYQFGLFFPNLSMLKLSLGGSVPF